MSFVFDAPLPSLVPVHGGGMFPVRRIFCVGKNYAKHVKEMGGDPKSSSPVFFTKPADAIVVDNGNVPYPQATENFRKEMLDGQ